MLTVWCVCWGDKYPDYYVTRLQREVKKYLTIPHRFVCITDRVIDGVTCQPFSTDFPGWWAKIELFRPDVASAQNLYLDLDVVLTGNISQMVYDHRYDAIAAPSNWAQSGHGGVQSSVMLWNDSETSRKIYEYYDPTDPRLGNWPPTVANGALWGDQEWITDLRSRGIVHVTPITSGIYSYKYHCRGGLPADAKVVVFHGDPKPAGVREPWYVW